MFYTELFIGLKLLRRFFKHRGVQGICVALYCIAASTIFFGAFLPSGRIQTSVHRGNVWLGFLIYLLTYIAASDIIVLILKLINKKKKFPY